MVRSKTGRVSNFRFRGVDLFHLEFIGYDKARRLLRTVWNNGGIPSTKEEGYHIIGFSRPPASITAKMPGGVAIHRLPFRLENVPLPEHERMPERLEPLDYSRPRCPGHGGGRQDPPR